MEYLTGKRKEGCIFCKHSVREEHLILFEGERCAVMMNKYPLQHGTHPRDPLPAHFPSWRNITGEEWLEMFRFTDCASGR
jgi:ATP adenylyltransferase